VRPTSDPDLEPEFDEIARLLDATAEQEARDMRAAEGLREAPGAQRVEQVLGQVWGPARTEAPARSRRGWVALGVVAAAVLLAILWLRERGSPQDGPRGQYLGGGELELIAPPARASRWDRIEWRGSPQGTYRVRVLDAETGAPVLGPVQQAGTALAIAPEESARWPRRILIEIEERRDDGSWSEFASGESERAP